MSGIERPALIEHNIYHLNGRTNPDDQIYWSRNIAELLVECAFSTNLWGEETFVKGRKIKTEITIPESLKRQPKIESFNYFLWWKWVLRVINFGYQIGKLAKRKPSTAIRFSLFEMGWECRACQKWRKSDCIGYIAVKGCPEMESASNRKLGKPKLFWRLIEPLFEIAWNVEGF